MAKNKKPAVVAELGRPETPEETAARKAEDSRLYRQRKTVNNLVLSLIVCLAVMFAFVLLVPQGTGDYLERNVDVHELAVQAGPSAGLALANPETPDGWLAKQAELRFSKDDQVTYWYIGYNTPDKAYAAVVQGFDSEMQPADARWTAQRLETKASTGTTVLDGHEWTVYDHQNDSPDDSNVLYGLSIKLDQSTLIVSGTATQQEIESLASETLESILSQDSLQPTNGEAGSTPSTENSNE
ncbi:MAG: DUF4245 domain-containing protein [Canibacter sp.]